MSKLLTLLLLTSCGMPQFSPWQSKPKYKDLTSKNLGNIIKQSKGFGQPFKVALIADSQAVFGGLKLAKDRINARQDIDFTVVLGDITDRGLIQEWNLVGDILNRLNKPYLTVVGNHDGINKGDKIYREMYGPLDYLLHYNGLRLVFWNNNPYEWDEIDKPLFAEESEVGTVVFSHQPPNSGSISRDIEDMWENERAKPGYIASVHGHKHHFGYYTEGDTQIFVGERVKRGRYGVMEYDGTKLTFYNCEKECEAAHD